MTFHCAVQNCSNGSYRLNKWKKLICVDHGVNFGSGGCNCPPPFTLTPFPTRRSNPVMREKWMVLINREDKKKGPGTLLSPSKNQRVCSDHFVDKVPTMKNPYPTKHLGYIDCEKKVQKMLTQDHFKEQEVVMTSSIQYVKKTELEKNEMHCLTAEATEPENIDNEPIQQFVNKDQQNDSSGSRFELQLVLLVVTLVTAALLFFRQIKRLQSDYFTLLMQNIELKKQIGMLKKQIEELKNTSSVTVPSLKKRKKSKSPKMFKNFITEKNVQYFTGIQTKKLIKIIHDYVKDFVARRPGSSKIKTEPRNFRKTPAKFGPKRFLDSIDELLLVLMRLRLGLDLKDLSHRFRISQTLASRIFTVWIKGLAAVFKNMLQVPDLESVLATKPTRYRGKKWTNLLTIIDATELFIETPQDLALQSCTWSDYKHHNTLKILIAVCPNSYICYVSPTYEGRISDTELTKDCGFLELLPPCSVVMADKGFNLHLECARLNLGLEIPPGRRGQCQMPTGAVRKTKEIANLRILVEQVIRRLKGFRILRNELTLSSTVLIDEAVIVCAALCNLKGPIYSD